jgi:MoaA/NifB/PqqE/SkfB family radical SAM enzyme
MSTATLPADRGPARPVTPTPSLPGRKPLVPGMDLLGRGLDFAGRAAAHLWRNRRYLTILKLANMALVQVQFRLKTERVLGRPYTMKIESTNICNTKCQLCPTGLGLPGRAKGRMTIEQYCGLIDRLGRFLCTVDLSMWGDPLIVPEIYDMIRYTHDRGIWTYLSSNLHAFKPDKDHARRLVESGLDMLTCSLHGASQETFAAYQPGKSFAETLAKVRHIIATRDRLGSKTPGIQLNFVVTRVNEHETAAFQELADRLGCRAVFSAPSVNIRFLAAADPGSAPGAGAPQPLGLAPDLRQKRIRTHMQRWLPADERYVLKAYQQVLEQGYRDDRYNGRKMYDCSWPWLSSVINWDGSVVTCCGSWDPKEDMGNVFAQPFGRIWNSPKYRLARRSFRRRLTAPQARDNPCATCPGFML